MGVNKMLKEIKFHRMFHNSEPVAYVLDTGMYDEELSVVYYSIGQNLWKVADYETGLVFTNIYGSSIKEIKDLLEEDMTYINQTRKHPRYITYKNELHFFIRKQNKKTDVK